MRILITGGGGFLGSHLGDHLLRQGHEVFALDTAKDFKVRHNLGNPRFHYVKDSILSGDMLESLVRRCEVVYHLAAVVGVEHYVADPYSVLNVNINGTQSVLRLALLYDRKVVFSSTSEIYGRNPDVPFREDSERVLGPTTIDRWCYSTSKAAGEHFCFAYAKMGVPVVVVRYFNAYGPRLDQLDVGRILTIFMGQLLRGEHLTVIGDGRQTRCFTYVDDAIRATVTAATKPEAEGRVFNIGVEKETTIRELAETMIDVYGDLTGQRKSKIRFVKQEDVYGKSYEDIRRRVPDTTRMRKELKVVPLVDLREGVRRTMKWFLDAHATAGEGERVVGPGVAKSASKVPAAAAKGRKGRRGR
jgi:UDP-glucose 4-epimerase